MAKLPLFGCEEFKKALKYLGFEIDESRGKGGHALAKHHSKKSSLDQRTFITIKGDKEYYDPSFRGLLVRQTVAFGFTRDEVIAAINKFK